MVRLGSLPVRIVFFLLFFCCCCCWVWFPPSHWPALEGGKTVPPCPSWNNGDRDGSRPRAAVVSFKPHADRGADPPASLFPSLQLLFNGGPPTTTGRSRKGWRPPIRNRSKPRPFMESAGLALSNRCSSLCFYNETTWNRWKSELDRSAKTNFADGNRGEWKLAFISNR